MEAAIEGRELEVCITDYGRGIENVERALEPFYTTGSEKERSGMGFTFMEVFMDELSVQSEAGKGTVVKMKKRIGETVL